MELKGVVVEYFKDSKKALSLVELFNILFIKNLISSKDRDVLKIGDLKTICTSLVKEGVLIENISGKFSYNTNNLGDAIQKISKNEASLYAALPPEEPNALIMMWEYAEHKTNKKLEAVEVFNFYAEGKKRDELAKIMDDFIDYFKIEKNNKNLTKWEHHFSNALLIQGIITKWD